MAKEIEKLLVNMIYNGESVVKVPMRGPIVFGPAWKGDRTSRDFFERVGDQVDPDARRRRYGADFLTDALCLETEVERSLREFFEEAEALSPTQVALLEAVMSEERALSERPRAVTVVEDGSLVLALGYDGQVTLGGVDVETAAARFVKFLADSVKKVFVDQYLHGVDGR